MNFFKYKDDFIGFTPDTYGPAHIVLLIVTFSFMIAMMFFFFRKKDNEWMTKFLKVMSIIVFVNEATYITWEAIECNMHGHAFNFDTSLPLYTCSLFIYCLIPAAWAKGKVQESCLAFLTTIGIFAGATGVFTVNGFKSFPIFTYGALYSYFFHYSMLFIGIAILVSKYYTVSIKSAFLSFIPILILSIIVIPVNYALKGDYMLLYAGIGAPLMPSLAEYFASLHLRGIYTVIMLISYIPIALLVVGIDKGVGYLFNLLTNRNDHIKKAKQGA